MATISTIKSNAELVKNASVVGENTATRVGGVLVDIASLLEDLEGESEGKLDASSVVQSSGSSTSSVMSQNAVTQLLRGKGDEASAYKFALISIDSFATGWTSGVDYSEYVLGKANEWLDAVEFKNTEEANKYHGLCKLDFGGRSVECHNSPVAYASNSGTQSLMGALGIAKDGTVAFSDDYSILFRSRKNGDWTAWKKMSLSAETIEALVADEVATRKQADADLLAKINKLTANGNLNAVEVVDGLTSDSSVSALSAKQGKVLNAAIESEAEARENADKTLQNSIEDLASRLYPTIEITELDSMCSSTSVASALTRNTKRSRYVVTQTLSSTTRVVGYLDVLSDNMSHVVTQVLTTHHPFTDGVLDTSAHIDSKIYQYYRSYSVYKSTLTIDTGTWTEWKMLDNGLSEMVEGLADKVTSMSDSITGFENTLSSLSASKVTYETGTVADALLTAYNQKSVVLFDGFVTSAITLQLQSLASASRVLFSTALGGFVAIGSTMTAIGVTKYYGNWNGAEVYGTGAPKAPYQNKIYIDKTDYTAYYWNGEEMIALAKKEESDDATISDETALGWSDVVFDVYGDAGTVTFKSAHVIDVDTENSIAIVRYTFSIDNDVYLYDIGGSKCIGYAMSGENSVGAFVVSVPYVGKSADSSNGCIYSIKGE